MAEDRAKSFLQLIRRSQRGRLKIYLGYGPGVGKTYRMLEEAHRLLNDGIDVVVGIVETHGRAETAAQVEGLELIPRRSEDYRGIRIDEMDTAAILRRRPQVVLVDELAHTNSPGSRKRKRYEDVQDLLFAGIHVITSLNIQHLESLYNTVEQLLGVRVRERIPDSILADADEVVNVDLTTVDLQRRLKDGLIYPKERVAPSLENFFQTGNLEHLRELTMREIASQIDFKRRDIGHETDTLAPDQIMVCLASKGPNSARLLRAASRLAGRLNRNWYAVYVQTRKEDPTLIDAVTQRLLAETLTLANQLGATVFTFKGDDIVQTILNFAREYRVGQIVIGKPKAISIWKRRLIGEKSIAERLMLRAQGVTIVVVDAVGSSDPTPDPGGGHQGLVAGPLKSVDRSPMRLGALLKPAQILIVALPLTRREVIAALVNLIVAEHPHLSAAALVELIDQRERKGSTFLNEGIALPHATVAGLRQPLVALAVTKRGITDGVSERPIGVVFLLLDPAPPLPSQAHLLSQAMKLVRTLGARRDLESIENAQQLLERLQAAEDS